MNKIKGKLILLGMTLIATLLASYQATAQRSPKDKVLSNLWGMAQIEPGPQSLRKGFWLSAEIAGGISSPLSEVEREYISPSNTQAMNIVGVGVGYHFNHVLSALIGINQSFYHNIKDLTGDKSIFVEAQVHPFMAKRWQPLSFNARVAVPYESSDVPCELSLRASWYIRNRAWLFGFAPTIGVGYMPFTFNKLVYRGIDERGVQVFDNLGNEKSFRFSAFFGIAFTLN